MTNFSSQLQILHGITALIGGGGKTTLMYLLATELEKKARVILTTSTHIFPPAHLPVFERIAQATVGQAVCVATPTANGKLTSPAQSFEELAAFADYILVEADGSAGRPLKAHAPHEPVIPPRANQVIAVVGASGFGIPIREAAHRPERYAALAQTGIDTPASPEMAAHVLEKEALHTRIFINQADSPARIEATKALAQLLTCGGAVGSLLNGEIICSF